MSTATLTELLAAVINNSGGDIGEITLPTSSARLHRAAARKELAATVREEFSCCVRQINFDGKLMKGLGVREGEQTGGGPSAGDGEQAAVYCQDGAVYWEGEGGED